MTTPSAFEPPHIIPPSLPHTHTIIALHGRGSQGPEFAEELFENTTSSSMTLRQHFPHCKWVFPSSQERFSTVFQEEMDEWFDIYSLTDPSKREELQVEGLRDSIAFLQEVIKKEAAIVRCAGRVVLLGLSQGCATGLMTLLAGYMKLGAFVGLNGWMPFSAKLKDATEGISEEEMGKRLGQFYKKSFGFEAHLLGKEPCSVLETPMFLGHTLDDEVVDHTLGEEVRSILELMGMNVRWEALELGGHLGFLETQGLDHVVHFLEEIVGK